MGLLDLLLRRRSPVPVTLYTRPDCGLCEEMKAEMGAAGVDGQYSLIEVDVDSQRALKKRYGLRIPVLVIDGEELFEGRLERGAFRRAVREAGARPGGAGGESRPEER